ncbi:hypothetical protein NVP1215B_022 [Vibrio phage 1.215.B._10N.222.54.F7]|nr:hypothetical protein NVP1215A_022 [Vibrio phage 1.215.A._10N.222.54.F7]AUR96045.1 hypothetical protein NVP1215B_022 [Vibrio phage 1.215.B._10N.222.54.F7]
MKYDYEYINITNPYHVVKFTLCGEFVEIGTGECTEEQLLAMEAMVDVKGFVIVDPEATNLTPELKKEVEALVRLGDPRELAVRTAICEAAKKSDSGAYNLHYS